MQRPASIADGNGQEADALPLRPAFTRRSSAGQVTPIASSSMVVRARPSGSRVVADGAATEVLVPELSNGKSPAERASTDQLLRRFEDEQEQLRAEIRAAQERIDRAGTEAHPALAAAEGELAGLVIDAHRQLTRLEKEHREAIESIRDRALAEASRLLADARTRALEVRARAAQLLGRPDDQPKTWDASAGDESGAWEHRATDG
jgi:hypothetical protein